MQNLKIGKYLTLEQFCTCTTTYNRYSQEINPFPQQPESITAIKKLNELIIEPVIDNFGLDNFQLTYGFCSVDLKKYLNRKDPDTGIKNGRIDPKVDQHMAHEINRRGNYFCPRLGAACDFRIHSQPSDRLVDWLIEQQLPFDSLYFYGHNRPIHISHGPQNKRAIWTFTATGQPTRKGIEKWVKQLGFGVRS